MSINWHPHKRDYHDSWESVDTVMWCLVILCVVFVAWLLSSCGGSPAAAPQNRAAAQFSDPRLQALWVGAQQDIITNGAVLNAALIAENQGCRDADCPPPPNPITVYPSAAAVNAITPNGVTVTTVPDITPGVIAAPAGATAQWCHSYTQGNAVYVAESMLYDPGATGYEFENVILAHLGYDTSGR